MLHYFDIIITNAWFSMMNYYRSNGTGYKLWFCEWGLWCHLWQ